MFPGAGGEHDDGSSTRTSESFPPAVRVRRRGEYRLVQTHGRRVQAPHFVLMVRARGDDGAARLGITVTRKVANAVGRNRVKRVVREVFRKNRALFPTGADVVVLAKSGAPKLGYAEVLGEIAKVSPALFSAKNASAK